MIISDEHKFAFIHIPKCAGSFVRKQLEPIDSYSGKFSGEDTHPALGRIFFRHLPLQIMADHFPEEFRKVQHYNSVAIVRNPHERFTSALMQWLRKSNRSQSSLTLDKILPEALRIIDHLANNVEPISYEYIEFTRQISFIMLYDESIVKNLYLISQMSSFANFVTQSTGISFNPHGVDNMSIAPRSAFVRLAIQFLRPIYLNVVPLDLRYNVAKTLFSWRLYESVTKSVTEELMRNPSISHFVEDYYGADLALFRSLSLQKTK